MKSMVISFDADGSIEHTLKDTFFKVEGKRSIERVSEIKFNENLQKFYIKWLKGPFAGRKHRNGNADAFGVRHGGTVKQYGGVHLIVFDTYEGAVGHEVDMLNAMRKARVSFK